ncbi:MAG: hypothetical protein Q8P69_01090 [bacterium]|nr:hypothetical protein [bacterium]
MRNFKICFYLILIVSILGFSIYPSNQVHAAVGVKFVSCVTGGVISPWLTSQINTGLDNLLKKIPGLGKYFGGSLGGGMIVPVNDSSFMSAWTNKELRGDILSRCTAREIFNAMSKGIIDNARTAGRDGGVAFVRNWRNFQTDAQYRGENIFRAVLSNTKLCNYIDNNIKSFFGVSGKTSLPANTQTRTGNLDPYQLRANCTMPSNFNIVNYQKDFAGNGGWDAWSRMLEPQNNYYGALLLSLDEVSRQRNLEQSSDLSQVAANAGFTGKSGSNAQNSCKKTDVNGKCLAYNDIKTPGIIISESVAATIQQELGWITNVHDVGEVISAATEVLLNRLIDLSNPDEGDYTIYEPPTISDPPETPEPGGTCPVPTTPATLCASVDSNTVLGILNNYPPSDAGITEAIVEVQGIYPEAYVVPHNTGTMVLDKIDFGGGMIVDVIIGAGGANPSWGWLVECQCGG